MKTGGADRLSIYHTRLWHGGWALGMLACAAALLMTLGATPGRALAALTVAAAPGLIGCLWSPEGDKRYGLVAIWAVAAATAAAIEGGVSGPLALWCATPLLAAMLLRILPQGLVLSVAALAALSLVQLSGATPPPPTGPEAAALAIVAVLALLGAAAGALALALARISARERRVEIDRIWFETVLTELPHMALSLGPDGAVETVFGVEIPGLEAERLRSGLIEAASEADRPTVRSALCEALDHGQSVAVFAPAASDRRVTLTLRRRSADGLAAIISDTTAALAEADERGAALTAQRRTADRRLRLAKLAKARARTAVGRAVAARREAEARQAEAEAAAAAKSRFLANMSHELRTPLNAIMGFSDIMRSRMFGELSAKYGEYAELIHDSGRHLTDLINDVLDMSKIEADRYALAYEVFEVKEALNAALRLLRLQADDAGVQLRGLLPPGATLVRADRRALKQIVLNLVSNALKFTPGGGSVTVSARAVDGALELVVADTGVGIAPEDLDRLGQPYEQAGDADQKARGTGLGLSLVRALTHLHGGEMTIESALGEGTAITLRMPVLHQEPEAGDRMPPPSPSASSDLDAHADADAEADGEPSWPDRDLPPSAPLPGTVAVAEVIALSSRQPGRVS